MWRAVGALCLGLVAASESSIDHVPIPRLGLWAPRTAPTVLPLHAAGSGAHRPSLWSTKYEPPFQAQQFNPAAARVLEQKEFRVPPALKKPLLAAAKVGAHAKPPVPALRKETPLPVKPASLVAKSVLWQPTSKPAVPPLSLAKEFDTPSFEFGDTLSSRPWEAEDREEEESDEEENEDQALQASDPILAKLDNIAAALHAMRHPQERVGGPQLGVAQLHKHVFKAPLPRAAPPASPKLAPRPAAAVAGPPPMLHAVAPAARAVPAPVHHAAPAVAAPRPELSALRKQTRSADDGLNRLFGDDAGKPTAPPPIAKKKVLALARVVGAVAQIPAVAAPETSLASIYSRRT